MIIQLQKSVGVSKRKKKSKRFSKRQAQYKIYLKSYWWKTRRYQKIKTIGRCEVCNSNKKLIVHHIYYSHNGKSVLYAEQDCDLAVLCKYCHNRLHRKYGRGASFGVEAIIKEKQLCNCIL